MRPTTRERHLASDERAGVVARRSVHQRHRETVRRNWRYLLVMAVVLLFIFGTAAFLAPGPVQRGVLLGSGVTFTAWTLAFTAVLVSGTAPLIAGGLAEMWTADELRPLREHGWRLVNHAGLSGGDLDHVLVGPGGIVVVETKWRSDPRDVVEGQRFFEAVVERAARSARQLGSWHEVARHGRPPVQAVVAVWGPAARDLRARRHASGVVVVPGPALREWMLRRGRAGLTEAQADAVFAAVDRQVSGRDRHEAGGRPLPRTPGQVGRALGVGATAAGGVLLAVGWLARESGSATAALGVLLCAVIGSEAVARRGRWTWEARAAQLTMTLLLALVLVRVLAAL